MRTKTGVSNFVAYCMLSIAGFQAFCQEAGDKSANQPLPKIAFSSERDGNSEIYVMNSDGSEQTRLTFNDAGDTTPAWAPFID